jgi:hypothetical protein
MVQDFAFNETQECYAGTVKREWHNITWFYLVEVGLRHKLYWKEKYCTQIIARIYQVSVK